MHHLAGVGADVVDALARVIDELGAGHVSPVLMPLKKPPLPVGDLTPETIGLSVAALMPEMPSLPRKQSVQGGT